MIYLREGLLQLEALDGSHRLLEIETGREQELDQGQAELARRLITGIEDEQETERALEQLGPEVVEQRDEPFDRVLGRRLEELDQEFSWTTPGSAKPLVRLCQLAHSMLRHARLDLDQLPVLPETAARRALLLRRSCGPGAEVALVGDDDLVAVGAALLGLRPTVLDLDPDLAATLRRLSQRLGLPIEVHQLDLRQPLPRPLRGRFQAFCTDPETSRECINLFLSRGLSLLAPGGIGLVAGAEEWEHLIEEARSATGARRIGLLRRAGNYRDWTAKLSTYRSDLHLLAVDQECTPLVGADERFEGSLFPFGLARAEHLVATGRGCSPGAGKGRGLIDLLKTLVGDDEQETSISDGRPFPLRVVTAEGPRGQAQATVHADGSTINLDLWPAPATEADARRVAEAITEALGTTDTQLRSLRRLE